MSWSEIGQFFLKWWIEFALGGVSVILGIVARHYWKLTKENKKYSDEEKKQAFKTELTAEVKTLIKEVRASIHEEIENESSQVREEIAEYETNDCQRLTDLESRASILEDILASAINTLDAIKEGLLAVQGHEFRNKCRKLLAKPTISPEDFEQLESDHTAYNGLGGNHKGDSLFDQVKTKYYAQLRELIYNKFPLFF